MLSTCDNGFPKSLTPRGKGLPISLVVLTKNGDLKQISHRYLICHWTHCIDLKHMYASHGWVYMNSAVRENINMISESFSIT